jgi:two-component system sensor histidine kinase YesM
MGSNEKSFFKEVDNVNCLVTIGQSAYNHWNYISIIPVSQLMKGTVDSLKNTILPVVVIIVLTLLILSVLINHSFYKPIKQSISNIKNSLQKKSIAVRIDRNDEIGFVFNSFCDILNENIELLKNVFEREMFAKDAELKMLESQINPHFLYNTLGGAICMIKLNQPEKAEILLKALVELYRMTLDNKIKIVSIREEIENIKYYTIIQNIRYHDKIIVDFNIQDEVMECRIPKLLLQPIVENSIVHGMGNSRKAIHIAIKIYKDDEMLVLNIRDDGIGIPDDKLQEHREVIGNKDFNNDKFYALQNVNRRIKIYYGEQYGLSIDSVEGEWTELNIKMPVVV